MDASKEHTFQMLKDGNYSDGISAILQYLESPIKFVGVGVVYNRFNIYEISEVMKNIYGVVMYELGKNTYKNLIYSLDRLVL